MRKTECTGRSAISRFNIFRQSTATIEASPENFSGRIIHGFLLLFAFALGVPEPARRISIPHSPLVLSYGVPRYSLSAFQKLFAAPIRILGIISAVLFIITGARIFWGVQLLPTSTPLPSYAYPLLVASFVGWIRTLLRERA
jgi:hypothetical protein